MITPSEADYIIESWRALQEIRGARKPEGLASFVQRTGGVEDPDGEVIRIVGSTRVRPGLIRRAPKQATLLGLQAEPTGRSLDDWALRAWEHGFITGETRPTIDAFLEALERDISGQPVVRQDDLDALGMLEEAQQLEDDLGRIGIDATVRTEAEARAAIAQFNRWEAERGGEGEDPGCVDEGAAWAQCDQACVGA